jgi:MSHA pilin protein MshC
VAGPDFRASNIVASHFSLRRRPRGFTLVELITVIVLLGILGTVASSRLMAKKAIETDTFTQTMRASLRYGQKVAIAQNRAVYVRLNGENVALCFDAACATPVPAPAGNSINTSDTSDKNCKGSASWYCAVVPADVSYTVLPLPTASVFFFDQKGKPYDSADALTVESSSLAAIDITITGDGVSRTVTMERETGYVF